MREIRAVEGDRVIALDQLGDGAAHIVDISFVDPTREAMHHTRHSDSLSLTEEASRPGAFRLSTARSARSLPQKGIPDGTFAQASAPMFRRAARSSRSRWALRFPRRNSVADSVCELRTGRASATNRVTRAPTTCRRWRGGSRGASLAYAYKFDHRHAEITHCCLMPSSVGSGEASGRFDDTCRSHARRSESDATVFRRERRPYQVGTSTVHPHEDRLVTGTLNPYNRPLSTAQSTTGTSSCGRRSLRETNFRLT